MKKILNTAAAALAGMLAFGLAACTDGNDEYKPEVPTVYYEADKDYAGAGIPAKWDFTKLPDTNPWGLTDSEAVFAETGFGENGGLKQDDGTEPADAKLVPFGAWKKNQANGTPDKDGVAQSKNSNSSNLDKFDESAGFTLTLNQSANIVVKARGAGAAAPARFVLITKGDERLAYKANLRSSKAETFVVKGASAGEYKIYANGSCVYYIDLSLSGNSEDLKAPAQITELKLYGKDGSAEAPAEIPAFEVYETVEFTAYDVPGERGDDMTADAEWTSSNDNVATVKNGVVTGTGVGTAVIRARIGRFYDQRTVTVTKSTKTRATFFAAENLPTEEKELGLDWTADGVKAVADKLLKAVVLGDYVKVSDATINFFDENTSWSPKPTARVKTELKFTEAWDKVFGIRMKADKYKAGNFDQNFKFCEIKFTVTPTSSPVVIGLDIAAKGGKNVNITSTVGNNFKTAVKVGSDASAITPLLADAVTVSEATTVVIAFSVADSGKNGVGFGFQDLVLSASLAE